MAERTYLYGYGSGPWGSASRKTKAEILAVRQFAAVNPEEMRRLFALADAIQDEGGDFGFGGGARFFAEQDAEFRRRHFVVPCPGGIIVYDGKCWQRYSWAAPYAPPGRSWHEEKSTTRGAAAVDALGDHVRGTRLCAQFGLVNGISDEAWHYQLIEIPRSRALNQVWGAVAEWPLPGEEPEDMYAPLPRSERAYDSRPDMQGFVDDVYRAANQNVPLGPLTRATSPRKVFVGLEKAAHIVITAVGADPGFVKVAGVATEPNTSVANIDPDGVTNGSFPVATPDGHIYIWASATCDIIVDVFARWN